MDEFPLTIDYFAIDNINLRRRVVPDSPTKFHTVPSVTISKPHYHRHYFEPPPPSPAPSPSLSSLGNPGLETSEESTVDPRDVDAFQYFIENNDETFLLDEIEDEDDDESPLLSQIVPTDETVKEEQELKELEEKALLEEESPSSSSSSPLASSSSPSNSPSTSDPPPNQSSTTTTAVSTRKRTHSSSDFTPILVSKRPKLIVSNQKTETPSGSQSNSQTATSLTTSSSSSSHGGQAFRDIFNSLHNQLQRASMRPSPSTARTTFKPLFIQVTRITVILPIKSIASLKTLEKRVTEDFKVKRALHERLSRVSGANAIDCIERVLNTFVTSEVRRKMAWVETPGKFGFGSTILKPITFDSVRFHFPQATDSQLEQFTRNWFIQGNSISN